MNKTRNCPNCKLEVTERLVTTSGLSVCPGCGQGKHLNEEIVDNIYVVLSVDENGKEGICSIIDNDEKGPALPMISRIKEELNTFLAKASRMKARAAIEGIDLVVTKFKRCDEG